VFVSHDLAAMRKVCTRVLWFKQGMIQLAGPPEKVIEAYLENMQQEREESLRTGLPRSQESRARRWGSGEIEIERVATCDGQGRPQKVFKTFDDLIVRIDYRVKGPHRDPGFGVNICAHDGLFIHGANTFADGVPLELTPGEGRLELKYPKLPLLAGTYSLTVGATSGGDWSFPYDLRERVEQFEVLVGRPDGGMVCFAHQWSGHV
jgi:hypothetical protein